MPEQPAPAHTHTIRRTLYSFHTRLNALRYAKAVEPADPLHHCTHWKKMQGNGAEQQQWKSFRWKGEGEGLKRQTEGHT